MISFFVASACRYGTTILILSVFCSSSFALPGKVSRISIFEDSRQEEQRPKDREENRAAQTVRQQRSSIPTRSNLLCADGNNSIETPRIDRSGNEVTEDSEYRSFSEILKNPLRGEESPEVTIRRRIFDQEEEGFATPRKTRLEHYLIKQALEDQERRLNDLNKERTRNNEQLLNEEALLEYYQGLLETIESSVSDTDLVGAIAKKNEKFEDYLSSGKKSLSLYVRNSRSQKTGVDLLESERLEERAMQEQRLNDLNKERTRNNQLLINTEEALLYYDSLWEEAKRNPSQNNNINEEFENLKGIVNERFETYLLPSEKKSSSLKEIALYGGVAVVVGGVIYYIFNQDSEEQASNEAAFCPQ